MSIIDSMCVGFLSLYGYTTCLHFIVVFHTSPTPATPAHLCPLLLACSHQVRTSLVLQHVLPSLNEEAQVVAVVLGFLDQHTSHVRRRPGVYTELRDDLHRLVRIRARQEERGGQTTTWECREIPWPRSLLRPFSPRTAFAAYTAGEKIPNFAILPMEIIERGATSRG